MISDFGFVKRFLRRAGGCWIEFPDEFRPVTFVMFSSFLLFDGELPPETRTLTKATNCSLLIFDAKEFRNAETQAARARFQGEGRAGGPER